MKKYLCLALLLIAQGAVAQMPFLEEGCDVLAEIVQRSVSAAGTPTALPKRHREFGFYQCSDTAATTSRAFTESMHQLDIPLRWESPGIAPGDICLSHRLDQCYPNSERLPGTSLPGRDQFVRQAWDAIRSSLQLTIQKAIAPDISYFQTGTLEHAVRSQLWTTPRTMHGRIGR